MTSDLKLTSRNQLTNVMPAPKVSTLAVQFAFNERRGTIPLARICCCSVEAEAYDIFL